MVVTGKCKRMHLGGQPKYRYNLVVDGISYELGSVNEEKYIGVTIDFKLEF